MSKKPQAPALGFRSSASLAEHIAQTGLGIIDAREWHEEWADRWVVYADLVAFASRTMRSEPVVLNNIVRFDRASQLAAEQFATLAVRRFSDATFAIADTFAEALGFAVALSHMCLAFNREYLARNTKQFFIHLIVPRVTVACGRVLILPDGGGTDPKLNGMEARNILAGSAIVKAHRLERQSAGGLLTVDLEGVAALRGTKVRGDNGRVTSGLRRWIRDLGNQTATDRGEVFFHRRRVVDVPWLLMRPLQDDFGTLWGAGLAEGDEAIRSYLGVWDKSVREFYSPQNSDVPLDVSKHAQAAIRHAIQCHQLSHGGLRPRYQSVEELEGA
jgi:hypothetical protein